eukprot:TRINITY_DN6135_c0_g1_i1.p1 TRINITY_DN6135_c0_g1~~TRINITY_DN6135_c0_g1_i1.p1  ORF type:complete len:192 (+),score=41.84 TRINITY_DN6135_c0_g1_i1:575-1150(+)
MASTAARDRGEGLSTVEERLLSDSRFDEVDQFASFDQFGSFLRGGQRRSSRVLRNGGDSNTDPGDDSGTASSPPTYRHTEAVLNEMTRKEACPLSPSTASMGAFSFPSFPNLPDHGETGPNKFTNGHSNHANGLGRKTPPPSSLSSSSSSSTGTGTGATTRTAPSPPGLRSPSLRRASLRSSSTETLLTPS